MSDRQRPILCLDFDGVLHLYSSGWQGADIVADGPVPGAMAFLVEAVKHFEVHIYSSRSKSNGGRNAMRHAIHRWTFAEGLPNIMPDLSFSHEKPAAFLTIDDRAVCFTGTFPDPSSLLAFKPWNRTE